MKNMLRKISALMLVLILAGCQLGGPTGIEAVKSMMRQGDYAAAVDEAKKVLEKEPLNLEAWDLVAKSYIEDGLIDEANSWLADYLDMIDDNLDNDDFDLVSAVDAVGDFGRDIRREGEKPGDWYEKLVPTAIDTDELEWSYDVGDTLTFEVPSGSTLLYTFDGSNPRTNGMVYKDGITLDEAGYINLQLVVTNRYKEYSSMSYAYLDVYDGDYSLDDDFDDTDDNQDDGDVITGDLEAPELDIVSGAYDQVIQPVITNYVIDNYDYDVMYTLDGTDPATYEGNVQYYYDSIPLTVGEHTINIVAYSYESEEYSPMSTYTYSVTDPSSVKVGLYGLSDMTYNYYLSLFNSASLQGIIIEPIIINDLTVLNLNNLPDAVITYGDYAEELSSTGIIGDINDIYDTSAYEYYGDALKMGEIDGVQYMLPMTIRPEFMLYGDYDKIGVSTIEDLTAESDWYEYSFMYPADSPEGFLGIYYGLGGEPIDLTGGDFGLDRQIVEEALTYIVTMPDNGIVPYLTTMEEMMTFMDNYEVASFLMDDRIESYEDYYYSYYSQGALPLTEGRKARFYNIGTGLYTSSLTASVAPEKIDMLSMFYDYIMDDNYEFANVANSMASIPVASTMRDQMEYYSYIPVDDYIALVENGITENQNNNLYSFYMALQDPLTSLYSGASVSEVADAIMAIE